MPARPALTDRPGPPVRRLWLGLAAAVVLTVAAYFLVVGDSGLLHLLERRDALQEATAHQVRLQAQIDSLSDILERLETDPRLIERVAREEYGMIKPGERLYRVKERPAD